MNKSKKLNLVKGRGKRLWLSGEIDMNNIILKTNGMDDPKTWNPPLAFTCKNEKEAQKAYKLFAELQAENERLTKAIAKLAHLYIKNKKLRKVADAAKDIQKQFNDFKTWVADDETTKCEMDFGRLFQSLKELEDVK